MEPVNGLGPLSQLLRRKAGTNEAITPQRDASATAAESAAGRTAIEEIERKVRLKLKDLGPGAWRSTGFRRWVIAQMLTYEYSPRMQTEPKFVAMVQSVLNALERNAELKQRFDRVMNELSCG
jgi:hypothetical protein